jgi:fructokinase
MLVSLGEILFDFLPIEADGAITGFSMHPGGGPFNVAVGLARLGQPVAFAGKVADDFFGRRLRQTVLVEGVSDAYLANSATAPSTLAFVAHENGEPAFTFYGDGAADSLLTIADLPVSLFSETQLLHFGGISLLRGTTPETALTVAERLRGKALISLDPNVRPALIADTAGYRATLERAIGACDLLKISAADVAWLAPDHSVEDYAMNCLERGPCLVALTRGGAGTLGLRRRGNTIERLEAAVVPVEVADTVGAGDAFSAGLLAALADRNVLTRDALDHLNSADLTQALQYGTLTAAITCTRIGADPPRRSEVEQFRHERGLA